MHRRWINYKDKCQTDTHQPRNARFIGRAAVTKREESYIGRLLDYCRKMTDIFEREERNVQEMDKLQRKRQTDTHQPRNARFSVRAATVIKRK